MLKVIQESYPEEEEKLRRSDANCSEIKRYINDHNKQIKDKYAGNNLLDE